jgi:hypothetical protein
MKPSTGPVSADNADGRNCQVCGKLSGIPGMGICFSCADHGPEWAQHESLEWLKRDVGRLIKQDIDNRNHVETRRKKEKKANKLEIFYY